MDLHVATCNFPLLALVPIAIGSHVCPLLAQLYPVPSKNKNILTTPLPRFMIYTHATDNTPCIRAKTDDIPQMYRVNSYIYTDITSWQTFEVSRKKNILFIGLELISGFGIGIFGTILVTPSKPIFDLNLSIIIAFLTFCLFALIGIGIPAFFHS